MERRSIAGGVTLEKRDGEKRAIVGHASIYYDGTPESEYRLFDDVVERIMPGAFDGATNADVRALFNHDPNIVLGRSKAGTLKLTTDQRGLRYEIAPPETQQARDLMATLERGDVSGSSFSFAIPDGGVSWSTESRSGKTIDVREIRRVELYDVGPVTFPAYEGATSGIRAAGPIKREDLDAERHNNKRGGLTTRSMAHARARAIEVTA